MSISVVLVLLSSGYVLGQISDYDISKFITPDFDFKILALDPYLSFDLRNNSDDKFASLDFYSRISQ